MLTAIQHASMASKVVALQVASSATPETAPVLSPSVVTVSPTDLAVADSMQICFANKALPTSALLHMATLGGAELCNLEAYTGSLVPGKAFDALLVNLRPETGNPNVWWDDSDEMNENVGDPGAHLEAYLEKFFFCGDDRNISAVWVQGKLVGGIRWQTDSIHAGNDC